VGVQTLMLVCADLSQIEWRTAAWLSQCPVMLKEIRDGIDQHAAARDHLMKLPPTVDNRTLAKIFNFRMIYGGSAYAYFMDYKMPDFTLKEWENIVRNFYAKYHGLSRWHDTLCEGIYRNKGIVTVPTGLRFQVPLDTKKDGSKYYKKSKIENYQVQGLAAQMIKLATNKIRKELIDYPEVKMILQVHDEVILDTPEKYLDKVCKVCYNIFTELPKTMNETFGVDFNLPIAGDIEVGYNWAKVKEYEFGSDYH
jgi:DNA polymerase-1